MGLEIGLLSGGPDAQAVLDAREPGATRGCGLMTEVGLPPPGAALTLVSTFVIERWKLIRASHTAAFLVLRELEFHEIRFALSTELDGHPNATYELRFPSAAWSAHRPALLSGALLRDAESILNWYTTITALGFSLACIPGLHGAQISGPERGRLQVALSRAHDGARRITERRRKVLPVRIGIPYRAHKLWGIHACCTSAQSLTLTFKR